MPETNAMVREEEKRLGEVVEAITLNLARGGTIGESLKMGASDFEGLYTVAHSFMSSGKYDKAIPLLRFLCLYDHTDPRWSYALGVAYQKKSDWQKAIEAYMVATLLNCHDPRPQAQAGYCLMQMALWSEAVSALEGAEMVCGKNQPKLQAQVQAMLKLARERVQKNKEGK